MEMKKHEWIPTAKLVRQKKIEMTTRNLPKNFITEQQSGWARSGGG